MWIYPSYLVVALLHNLLLPKTRVGTFPPRHLDDTRRQISLKYGINDMLCKADDLRFFLFCYRSSFFSPTLVLASDLISKLTFMAIKNLRASCWSERVREEYRKRHEEKGKKTGTREECGKKSRKERKDQQVRESQMTKKE